MNQEFDCDSCLAHIVEWGEQTEINRQLRRRLRKQRIEIRELKAKLAETNELLEMQHVLLDFIAQEDFDA